VLQAVVGCRVVVECRLRKFVRQAKEFRGCRNTLDGLGLVGFGRDVTGAS
jgi:hypothetical protein